LRLGQKATREARLEAELYMKRILQMNMISRSSILLALAVLAPIILVLQPANLDAQTQSASKAQRSPTQISEKDKMNA